MPFTILNPDAPAAWLRSQCRESAAADLVVLALERAVTRDTQFLLPDVGVIGNNVRTTSSPRGHHFVPSMASEEKLEQVRHAIDWLVAAVLADEPWLKRTDAAGRPLKLVKIGSLDRAVREADKAMERAGSRMAAVAADRRGDVVFRELADGWTIVRLTTPESLDAESVRMQHCIGQGAYDGRLASGDRLYLSLRDPAGKPHVTIEIDAKGHVLLQLQGKQNRYPDERYVRRLLPYLRELHSDLGQLHAVGILRGSDGRLHEMSDLPDELRIERRLEIDMGLREVRLPKERLEVASMRLHLTAPPGTTVVLPRVLRVWGELKLVGSFVFPEGAVLKAHDLKLIGAEVRGLPENLEVPGLLELQDARTGALPKGLSADRLGLCRSDVVALPDDVRIGSLEMYQSAVTELPAGLRLRTLLMREGVVDRLPDGLVVDGEATIMDTSFSAFGTGTRIGGNLKLHRLPRLETLPDDLRVGLVLSVDACPVARIPADTGAKGIELQTMDGVALPEAVEIEGSLKLVDVGNPVMPTSISVGSDLIVKCLGPVVVPPGTTVGAEAVLESRTGSISIGAGTRVGDSSTIQAAAGVSTGRDVFLGSKATFRRIGGTGTLPDVAPGTLEVVVDACHGTRIPESFGSGSIEIRNCERIRLPARTKVSGDLRIMDTTLSAMPEGIRVGGSLLWDARSGDVVRLPDGMRVDGSGFFRIGSGELSLGADSSFGCDLDIGSQDVRIGRRLHVGGILDGEWLSSLPDGCGIGFFRGGFGFSSLGNGCRFGTLDLGACSIRSLPHGLVVTDDMNVGATEIEELPDDILVGGRTILPAAFVGRDLPPGVDRGRVDQEGEPDPDSRTPGF